MKKIIAILSVLMAMVSVLSACRNQNEDTPTTTADAITQPTETQEQREPGVYYVTVLPTANGTVTTSHTQAKEGDQITLTLTPDEGYELITLTANGKACDLSFAMPAQDVTVVARFGLPEEKLAATDNKVYPQGNFFGSVAGYHSSDVLNMKTDSGNKPYLVMDAGKATPLYAYVKGVSAKQFYFELTAKVTGIRSDEKYPKFGLLTNDGKEMVKFYLDMTTQKQVGAVGAVHQKSGKEDDWAGQSTWSLNKKLDLSSGSVKLGLLRNGKNYYLYVNGTLVASGSDLSERNAATGIFSFGTSLKVSDYKLVKSGSALDALLAQAQTDSEVFSGAALTENFFSKAPNGTYTLKTNSDAQHLVDDVTVAGKVMREAYYSLSGKLSLTDAEAWGQARILVSADPENEYFIALEKLGENNYQIFTMSKANEEGWNDWQLIESTSSNCIDFEVIVNADRLYFLTDNKICYTGSRVSMTEGTVKFTGYNVGTTHVKDLSLQTFANSAAVAAYVESKEYKQEPENPSVTQPQGTFFGSAAQQHSSDVLDMTTDAGENPFLLLDADKATPLFTYVKDLSAKQFYLELTAQVTGIRTDESYPKFGIMTHDGAEMVKFYLDMTTQKQVGAVGAVHQTSGGEDDWAGQTTWSLNKKLDLSSNSVKLGLLRDGKAYYVYVNDTLVASGSDLSERDAATGIFSFGTSLKVSDYKLVKSGSALDALLAQAQTDTDAFYGAALTENFFTKTANGVYTLTTNSDAQHLVDDVTVAGKVMREAYYSLSGKLSLTDAEIWGQARILVSADPENEYFIALEKLGENNYQIFTMSKANEEGWNDWQLIGSSSSDCIDFEVIVNADRLYFLIDNKICYTCSRVSMTESSVKFTGYNVGTTQVEDLSVQTFADSAAVQTYIESKEYKQEPEIPPVTQPEGEFFGNAAQQHSSDVLDMTTDAGENPFLLLDADKATPLFAYVKDLSEKQFYLELTAQVTGVRTDESYPKFGIMTHDGTEMVKFYLDMTTQKQVGAVGAVHQTSGGEDDWAGQSTWQLQNSLNLSEAEVTLSLLRNGKDYYFYVNGQLEAVGSDLSELPAAVGVFSFGTSVKLTDYRVVKAGSELDNLLNKAQQDVAAWSTVSLTTNYFTETEKGVYSLTTDSDAEHKVDDVKLGRNVLKTAYYSLSGKLTLMNANDWGQARILISADAKNEYFIALEKTNTGNYQIFTMSKANEEGWNNWQLIESASHNGSRNAIDFEVILNGDRLYFLLDNEICYISSRVSMTESTVKFTGYNVGTTVVENLSLQVFADSNAADVYVSSKESRFGENFGSSEGAYFTTDGVDLDNDKGSNPTAIFTGGAPQYAYLNDLHTDKFCFETEINVEAVLNNDAYPKFGIMVNGSSEMVKFFVDMTSAMTATHVGVVYQPTGGGDDWAGSVSAAVSGMSFTGSDTVKLKLVRDGRAYYFYVNDALVLYNEEGVKAEKGAVGIFSFNSKLTASGYSVLTGSEANSAIQSAKDKVAEQTKLGLTCNWFADNGNGVYTLTTDSNAEHKVDDLTRGGSALRTAYYSVKGKLTLTNAGDWGQARILISADANNEYFIALEKTNSGKYQIFTMSKANQSGWDKWELILHQDTNGTRNSIDFELIVIGNKLCFLIDGSVVYTSTRVSMTQSTVKFTGYNVGTTTVEDLSAEVFENKQEAESYLAQKNG